MKSLSDFAKARKMIKGSKIVMVPSNRREAETTRKGTRKNAFLKSMVRRHIIEDITVNELYQLFL